ncbi:MAG: IS1380 family transposase [Clostridia bacterium]|nr:IS1380 family transposase [Clostridia bacterium]
MINKVEFTAKNLTSNAGVLLLLNYTEEQNIFQDLNEMLFFENSSTEMIKMNHLKTLMCGGFVGIDKLERFNLLKNDPLIKECGIDVREPENISRFLYKFSFKTTQMLRDINFKTFKKLLSKKKLRNIVIDIDSRVVNVEGNQEGAVKGYNPGNKGNNCYNILMAFCDELKAYITGFMRSGNAYTANGSAEMIKEIIANLEGDVDNIVFRMDSGYFSGEIAEVIEQAGYQYVVKAKEYSKLLDKAYDSPVKIWENYGYQKQAMFVCMKPDKWSKARKFAVVRELKPEEERKQLSLLESGDYTHAMYVTNTTWELADTVKFYEKRGNCENYIKETKYDMNIGSLKMKSFWANEAFFQLMMLVYNIFLLFKLDKLPVSEYRQWILTFRLKYVFLAGKIIRTARQTILKLLEGYPYKALYQ